MSRLRFIRFVEKSNPIELIYRSLSEPAARKNYDADRGLIFISTDIESRRMLFVGMIRKIHLFIGKGIEAILLIFRHAVPV